METEMKIRIAKTTDMVITCELRAAYGEVECQLRHGLQPSKEVSDYIAALSCEQVRRAVA
jgi:hypothetical protein